MVGGGHQTHAERGPQHERVKIGSVFAVGNPRYLGKRDIEHQKSHQQQPDVGSERVEHEQPGENFLPRREGITTEPAGESAQIAPRVKQREGSASKCHPGRVEHFQHRQHPAHKQQHNGDRQTQFGAEQRQRHRQRVVQRSRDDGAEVGNGVHVLSSGGVGGKTTVGRWGEMRWPPPDRRRLLSSRKPPWQAAAGDRRHEPCVSIRRAFPPAD